MERGWLFQSSRKSFPHCPDGFLAQQIGLFELCWLSDWVTMLTCSWNRLVGEGCMRLADIIWKGQLLCHICTRCHGTSGELLRNVVPQWFSTLPTCKITSAQQSAVVPVHQTVGGGMERCFSRAAGNAALSLTHFLKGVCSPGGEVRSQKDKDVPLFAVCSSVSAFSSTLSRLQTCSSMLPWEGAVKQNSMKSLWNLCNLQTEGKGLHQAAFGQFGLVGGSPYGASSSIGRPIEGLEFSEMPIVSCAPSICPHFFSIGFFTVVICHNVIHTYFTSIFTLTNSCLEGSPFAHSSQSESVLQLGPSLLWDKKTCLVLQADFAFFLFVKWDSVCLAWFASAWVWESVYFFFRINTVI